MDIKTLFDISTGATALGVLATIFSAVVVYREAKKSVQLSLIAVAALGIGVVALLHLGPLNDLCANAPNLLLNEVCAEGDECGLENDFVELLNPAEREAPLDCYLISDKDTPRGAAVPLWRRPISLPEGGVLAAGDVRAWGEQELRLRLSHTDGDGVRLYRLETLGQYGSVPELIDEIAQISSEQSYWRRLPGSISCSSSVGGVPRSCWYLKMARAISCPRNIISASFSRCRRSIHAWPATVARIAPIAIITTRAIIRWPSSFRQRAGNGVSFMTPRSCRESGDG